jgi:CheY-like chemotaxis protein
MPISTLRVLIVDDYQPLRFLKAHILLRAGASVLEAGTGTACLQMLASEAVDLVLIDVNLPDMSGVELRRKLRESPATDAIPVIFTSVSERPTFLEKSELFIQEPVDAGALVGAVQRQVDRQPKS